MDFDRFEALTFDCYGTLIDWERGIVDALRPALAVHGREGEESEALLERFPGHVRITIGLAMDRVAEAVVGALRDMGCLEAAPQPAEP